MAVPAPAAPDNEWTIKAGDFNAEGTPFEGRFFAPYCGNGEIGIICGEHFLEYGPVTLGNAFARGGKEDVSIMLEGVNPFCINMFSNGEPVTGVNVTGQYIDMRRAVHVTELTLHPGYYLNGARKTSFLHRFLVSRWLF